MCLVAYGESRTMICVFVLQNIMDGVEGATGFSSGTCEKLDFDIDYEEVSMKVEDAIDIKDEISEAISFAPIKTEQEVRFWAVCDVVHAHVSMPFVAPKKKNSEIKLNYLLLCVPLSVPYTFRNLDCEPEEKVPCGSHSY